MLREMGNVLLIGWRANMRVKLRTGVQDELNLVNDRIGAARRLGSFTTLYSPSTSTALRR
jgi:hypothetical protein